MKSSKIQLGLSIISVVLSLAVLGLLIFDKEKSQSKGKVPDTYVMVRESNGDTSSVLASGWNLTTKQATKKDESGNFPVEVIDPKGKVIATSKGYTQVSVDVGSVEKK